MAQRLKGPAGILQTCLLVPALWACDPALTRLFTPAHPQLGRYEVCATPDAIERIVSDAGPDGPHYGPIERVQALDAFGGAGPYDRSALTRLYGGRRPKIARGWRQDGDRFESVTLISPYPDASLTRLLNGTMVIRLTIPRGQVGLVGLGPTRPSSSNARGAPPPLALTRASRSLGPQALSH